MVLICGDVNEFEIEEKDRGDPAIERRIWLYVRVTYHALDELGVHLDY
jgi:hypothetical protein